MKTVHNTIDKNAFANRYVKNILDNQVKVKCPTCGMETSVYPEHIDKAYCHVCEQNGIESKLQVRHEN